jgi:ribonuclease D
MTLVTDTGTLREICAKLQMAEYITVDTEFMRDKSYYSKLCLIQVAWEGGEYAIDPLAENMDLTPLFEVFSNEAVVKIFHSARQDIEIILELSGNVPTPLFDTQVAAMVCGFGDSAGYALLVEKIVGIDIDKSSRFTDWSRRPLSDKQLDYAISDVTYLRDVYKKLKSMLEENNRLEWLTDEMEGLTNPENYNIDPDEIWKRIKARGNSRRFFGILKELAKWRELTARKLNIPRNFVLRDQPLLEIASHVPKTLVELKKIREIGNIAVNNSKEVLELLEEAAQIPEDQLPPLKKRTKKNENYDKAIAELLKVLLKMKCEEHNVAERLIADSADIVEISSSNNPDVKAITGWRYDIFGKYAMDLKNGKIGLTAEGGKMKIVEL